MLARCCRRLKRLRIERGDDDQGMEDEEGVVSQRGLIALSHGCPELEYLAVYVSDITNASLEHIGTHLKNLCDFRLVLLDREEKITDLPLDNGVRALLRGCDKLRRFALYLRPGGLTDVGLGYIGQYSPNVRWMLLGYVGETDAGLLEFSKGCPSLQKLEMRGCSFFSEYALLILCLQSHSLTAHKERLLVYYQHFKVVLVTQYKYITHYPKLNIHIHFICFIVFTISCLL